MSRSVKNILLAATYWVDYHYKSAIPQKEAIKKCVETTTRLRGFLEELEGNDSDEAVKASEYINDELRKIKLCVLDNF